MIEDDKVTPIFPDLEVTKTPSPRKCPGQHIQIELDEKLRTATCKKCGFNVDPFDYLMSWAKEGERMIKGLKGIGIQIKIAEAEHADLMRRVKNMRSTLQRNGQPQPDEERGKFNRMRLNPDKAFQPEIHRP